MSAVIEKASPLDLGCWIDGHWGWRCTLRLIEIAKAYGWTLSDEDEREVEAYDTGNWGSDDSTPEIVADLADEAETWLNENVAPEGHTFAWLDGEFFLWTNEEWSADL